jgi:hypothetical protein
MIKIYKYDPNDKGFQAVVNDNTLKGKKRTEALDNWVKENGTEVSIKDYFNDCYRNSWRKDYAYRCFGKAENCIERLAWSEIDSDGDLSYCSTKENFPEDLIESRTDWDEMKNYADGLYYFIESLKSEIAEGKIILA